MSVMERAYRNLGYVLLGLVPIFVAGFWIPYLSQIPRFDSSITAAVHVHAVLLFLWLGLLIIQPLAIRYRAFGLHRMLGKASYVIMALIVPFAVLMIWKEYHEKIADGQTATYALEAELLSAAQLLVTVALYVLAVLRIRQRDVPAHMRYMISIALLLLPAGLSRTLGYWVDLKQSLSATISLAVIDLCLAGLVILDSRRGYNPRPYVVAFLTYNATAVVWLAMGRPV